MTADKRILIVDDLADMRTVLGLTLKRSGWTIIEASDGIEALEIARREKPHVILMDYNMPRLNGIDACRELKNDVSTADIAIVMFTGTHATHARQEAIEAGAALFLRKPILPSELRRVLDDIYQGD